MINYVEDIVELKEKIYPVRENWHLLKPYLNDEDVQAVLNKAMTSFCEQYNREWQPGNAPWEYTTSDYWCMKIDEKVEEDEDYLSELEALDSKWAIKLFGQDTDYDYDELWDNEEYRKQTGLLSDKYYLRHSPKEGTMEWYQFIHGCHWINQFTAALVSKALNVEAYVLHTTTHTIATFEKDEIWYYADVQLEWDSLQELTDFLGDEVDFYPIFD